jgi:hypothetical protein
MEHRFVIGIGSQRAGSTLLHHALEASTDIFMHPVKELHYFDTLSGVRTKEALKEFSLRQMAREVEKIVTAEDLSFLTPKRYKCYLRANKILASTAIENVHYLDLFRPCLMGSTLLGEVTPEYMLLAEPAIEKMKQVIGDNAAIVLICRNPVKRFLSAVKLMNSYNNLTLTNATAEAWIQKMLAGQTGWLIAQDRYNNYADAIANYSKHFRHFAAISYDEMVTTPEKTATQLAHALNLHIDTQLFKTQTSKVINNLGNDFVISEKTIQQLTNRYQNRQNFLNDFFGCQLSK